MGFFSLHLLKEIFEICIIPLLGILVKYFVDYLQVKRKELQQITDNEIERKYIEKITNTITTCVIATNQTYVDSLKQQGKFDAEAQKIAFEKTYEAVLSILDKELKDYIIETAGDLPLYLTQKIEAAVNENK